MILLRIHGSTLGIASLVLILWIAQATAAQPGGGDGRNQSPWKPLFDGKTLAGWKATRFGGEGEVYVEKGAIILGLGNNMTGITYTRGDFPHLDYEVTLEARRLKGSDFFCTATFPVGASHCSLVVGGWGGTVVGLSSIDGRDAARNDTRTLQDFQTGQWYRVRLRIQAERIQAWIDNQKVVDANIRGKKIGIRPECSLCRPFGLATWCTTGAVRDIRVRLLTAAEKTKR
jgi:hypothetical protein